MLRSLLASVAIAIPLFAACTVGTSTPFPVGDAGPTADSGVKEGGSAADSGTKDSGTLPAGEDACGTETTRNKCSTCCATLNSAANDATNTALTTCACAQGAGKCADVCAATACATPSVQPDAACDTCLGASIAAATATNPVGACRATLVSCIQTGPCKPLFACINNQGCNDKPEK